MNEPKRATERERETIKKTNNKNRQAVSHFNLGKKKKNEFQFNSTRFKWQTSGVDFTAVSSTKIPNHQIQCTKSSQRQRRPTPSRRIVSREEHSSVKPQRRSVWCFWRQTKHTRGLLLLLLPSSTIVSSSSTYALFDATGARYTSHAPTVPCFST